MKTNHDVRECELLGWQHSQTGRNRIFDQLSGLAVDLVPKAKTEE
jgi:hypothetical protein